MRGRTPMRIVGLFGLLLPILMGAACDKGRSPTGPSGFASPPGTAATQVGLTAQGIAIEGQYTMNAGDRLQVAAMVTMSDDTRQDMTSAALWTSENVDVVTVAGGLITAIAGGESIVSARYENITARLAITVRGNGDGRGSGGGGGGGENGRTLVGLAIEGAPMVPAGQQAQLLAVAHYSDGWQDDVTDRAGWRVSPADRATIARGLLTGVSTGPATVTASFEGAERSMHVLVTHGTPSVTRLSIAGSGSVVAGGTTQLTATATLVDGSQVDVTGAAAWTSANDGVAGVTRGTVSGVHAGTTTIHAEYGSATAHAAMQVTVGGGGSQVVSIAVTGTLSVQTGSTTQLVATATLADGTRQQVTGAASWTSGNTAAATVDSGLVTGVGAGSAAITARYQGISGQATVQVTVGGGGGPTLTGVTIQGVAPVQVGGMLPLTARATFSDGSQQDVSAVASWSSSAPQVATVSGGVLTGVGAGTATVSAAYQGVTTTADVIVSAAPATVIGLTVTGNLNLNIGVSTQLTVKAAMSNGEIVDVTALASYHSSNPLLVSVSASGHVTGLLAGLAQVTASYQGVSAQVQLQISASLPVLTGLSITGASSVRLLQLLQLDAVALMSDGTQQNVTLTSAWSSSNLGILDLLGNGLLRGLLLGNVTITVEYGGHTAQRTIQVTLL